VLLPDNLEDGHVDPDPETIVQNMTRVLQILPCDESGSTM
jgi:hypothetical protein